MPPKKPTSEREHDEAAEAKSETEMAVILKAMFDILEPLSEDERSRILRTAQVFFDCEQSE